MATTSARTNGLIGLILAAIAAELTFGVFGAGASVAPHGSAPRPVAAVVEAAFTQSPVTDALPAPAPVTTTLPPKSSTHAAAVRPAAAVRTATPKAKPATAPSPAPAANRAGWGCAPAVAYLAAHSAPGYQFVCPGYAEGHQAMTCFNTAACPGAQVIAIAIPCPAAYMNEAHNSWIISGLAVGKIDPYGYCS